MEITYISNEGFMLKTESIGVLIDSLHRGEYPPYDLIQPDVLEQMQKAVEPFDKIDLVLFTHHHYDHFDPYSTILHLSNNSKAKLVAPPQVQNILNEHFSEIYELVEGQINSCLPKLYTSETMNFEGIELEIYHVPHGEYLVMDEITGDKVNKHATVKHLMFLISIDGKKILHVGDTVPNDDKQSLQPYKEMIDIQIDLAFLSKWFIENPQGQEIVEKYIKPKKIIIMHLESEEKNQISKDFPKIFQSKLIIFEKSMDSITI
jgi:L-ascorbate metabolism protein UlaG (beta-lactamase superfamily)